MACSDNVVRAGLTPKYKDVDTLCNMLNYTFESANSKLFAPTRDDQFTVVFRPPVPDFAVADINIPPSSLQFLLRPRDTASILLVLDGEGSTDSLGIYLNHGTVLFLPAGLQLNVTTSDHALHMFQAFTNTRVGRKKVSECVPATLVTVEWKDVPATLVAVEQKDVPAMLVAVERKEVPATLVVVERKDVPATLVAVERKDVPATLVAVERKEVPATGAIVTDGFDNMNCGSVQAVERDIDCYCAHLWVTISLDANRYFVSHGRSFHTVMLSCRCLVKVSLNTDHRHLTDTFEIQSLGVTVIKE
uniref:Uncharacterized protein n=1 Tax=Timema bartmani TaxID=61472 RepID=A0A7R9I3T5_9NEOP|nr:unnamed protein product [Timema bartmani]